MWTYFLPLLHFVLAAGIVFRVLTRRGLEPSVRLAWVMVVEALPLVGILAYLMFGEVRMRRADRNRRADVRQQLTNLWQPSESAVELTGRFDTVTRMIRAVGGMQSVSGNRATLLAEDDTAMDPMIAAIDAAQDHVHLLFYIWLDDHVGRRIADAVTRAAGRGVTCRVMVDAFGSRAFTRSAAWAGMKAAGVHLAQAYPMGLPVISMLWGRLDLRNHRKIAVVDGRVGFTGSRNASDQAFAVKAKYAPWVDIQMQLEGPVVRQMQATFLQDWMSYTGSDLGAMLDPLPPVSQPGQVAQVLPTGPDWREGTMSDALVTLIHASRERLVLTTPYYIPDQPVESAIASAARRGVAVTLILPARNDSRLVQWVSEGFYRELLDAGVRIYLFKPGLLHAKIITVDGQAAMIGSANLDRRSFDLNYEMNVFWVSESLTAALDARQQTYIDRAAEITRDQVRAWSFWRRARANLAALAAPLL
ncbi:MAG: cardiolipin synthase [Paracoccus sp. (in: a-proteobacteria)]|uniref:cardiolipin synthase n=1 Tax=Paracoccus sp. TaxID=267 RepID=UPI0026DF7979|nr:cardiolipin synthase [Paracoccus sp. (in: a-proteobacteria)]MDO5621188.1 cardiolipin synthase [Paracoccus sp. (in: a-proteobacteria)]